MTYNEYIRKHLLKDMPDIEPIGNVQLSDVDANRKQFEGFIELMNNRIRQGFFRYGRNEPGEPARIKYFEHIKMCLSNYEKTGNQEYLVDAANSCRLEFLFPLAHPSPHFSPGDDGEHAEFF